MPIYNKAELAKRAKELSVVRDTFEKVLRLCEILRFFDSDELLSSKLALKGGTAINLLLFDLPRLSVDIDLDFSSNVNKDEMLLDREKIHEKLIKFMVASGYSLSSKSKTYHSLYSYVFEYTNTGGMKDNIKVEINYSLRSHVLPLQVKTISDTIISEGFKVNIISPIEIYAAKTVALLTRGAARDLYDMNYMIRNNLFSENELSLYHKCVVFYLAIATESPIIKIDYRMMDNITPHKIVTDLKPVIRDRDAFDLEPAQNTVKSFLNTNLSLDDQDIKFLTDFKNGIYNPDILFDAETYERVKKHPMALWKTTKNAAN